ncbi:phospholipid scramblase 1-like isoform X2 [Ahaetulla prasina]|uniref:phospholipid scramblase 1-like isoform X2 n=1 Tax=Ahaetulla prasina TaxID=499056 RepID=UPI002648D7B0|nr:phospholipid scramblase 1-like isoform X2 [Ahaetulla prasina]
MRSISYQNNLKTQSRKMESKQPPPTEPPPEYQGPSFPGQGYAVPGYPGTQVQVGIPQNASGLHQYVSPSTLPIQPHALSYGALQAANVPSTAEPVVWMPAPPVPPKCPPGLEYLSEMDQVIVDQQLELMEMISGYETCNKYEIKNSMGQWVYFAAEENDEYNMYRYGPFRSFTIKLFDSANQPVIQLSREFHCTCGCPCICCLQKLEVQAPLGTVIGYVKQKCYICRPKFVIQNEAGENILKLHGPNLSCHGYRDFHFEVKSFNQNSSIGKITRKWKGLAAEAATDASNFLIQFPMDLEIKTKTLLLGACFLLDFLFFERSVTTRRNQT